MLGRVFAGIGLGCADLVIFQSQYRLLPPQGPAIRDAQVTIRVDVTIGGVYVTIRVNVKIRGVCVTIHVNMNKRGVQVKDELT